MKEGLQEKMVLPEGVTASVDGDALTVKGSKGELRKVFRDVFVKLSVDGNAVLLKSDVKTRRQKMVVGTFISHIKNLAKGVTEGFTYKLTICSGHFPMTVTVSKDELVVKNFIGEKVPRKLKLRQGVDVKVDGIIIIVELMDKEFAGQTAASIEQLARRSGFDSRIFQAGIYITDKAGKDLKSV